MEGQFIAFEGIDGAGTTTQARMLHEALLALGMPTHLTQEPSDGPIGHVIRDALAGRLVVNGLAGPRPPGWATMALLFAADRVDHLDAEVIPNLVDGVTVICDRYVHSSLVYQTETSGAEAHRGWVGEINRRARRPDLTLLLDVDPQVAAERRHRRRSRTEIFDDAELQVRLAARYRRLPEECPEDRIVIVDGNRSVEDVHRECWSAVERFRSHREER